MKKEEVLKKIDALKGRPIEIGLADEGAVLYAGIDGHWLFIEGDNLVEIKLNACDGIYGFSTINQQQNPFIVTTVQFDTINYVRSYFGKTSSDISYILNGLTPVGTEETIADIKKDLETNSIRKAQFTAGYTENPNAKDGDPYDSFKGSRVSTSINGFKGHPVSR